MPTYFIPGEGEEEARAYEVERCDDGLLSVQTPEGQTLTIDAYRPGDGQLHFITDGHSFDADVRERDGKMIVQLRGQTTHVQVLNERQMRMKAAGVGGGRDAGPHLESPMAGKVVALQVAEGDEVEEGQSVIIVEAMKMENDLKAHRPGIVESIGVDVGQAVEIGDVLVTIADA